MKKFIALVLVGGLLAGGILSANTVAHEEGPQPKVIKVAHEEGPITPMSLQNVLV
jgi:hypothetical protein